MTSGYWIPVLHSHLPFIKHPEYDFFLEEHWLFEAISETYIPLLMRMEKLIEENTDFRLTISLTPPLCEMLADDLLKEKYLKYIDKLIELSGREVERLKEDSEFHRVAFFYYQRFREIRAFYVNYLGLDVIKGYRLFNNNGNIEIITCGATHGFLPLLRITPRAVEAQIEIAVATHIKHFKTPPRGIWLPECAYFSGLDGVLKQRGIQFFFLDTHGLNEGKPAPRYSVYAPVYTINEVAVFARDPHSSNQVWSSEIGYPGDFDYRDFYKDIGFDLDFDYIKPYISPDGIRVFTGIKYYKVTGGEGEKKVYNPEAAYNKTIMHARHFYSQRVEQVKNISPLMDRPAAVVSPYDAELFGHWWFEGPDFLYNIFKEIKKHGAIEAITPVEYLEKHPKNQVILPSPSSWGGKGYYGVWINEGNDWIYRHLHYMADKMAEIADEYGNKADISESETRILNQMVRELLLAQSSDWAFLMTTQTAVEYSTKRTKEHIYNFEKLYGSLLSTTVDYDFLFWLEYKNSIFQELDFRVFMTT